MGKGFKILRATMRGYAHGTKAALAKILEREGECGTLLFFHGGIVIGNDDFCQ